MKTITSFFLIYSPVYSFRMKRTRSVAVLNWASVAVHSFAPVGGSPPARASLLIFFSCGSHPSRSADPLSIPLSESQISAVPIPIEARDRELLAFDDDFYEIYKKMYTVTLLHRSELNTICCNMFSSFHSAEFGLRPLRKTSKGITN